MAKQPSEGKVKRPAQGPRPAYMVYRIEGDEIVAEFVTRKSDEMLEYVTENPGAKWVRFKIK